MKWPICWSNPGKQKHHLHFTAPSHTHTHRHAALPHVGSCQAPYTLVLSVILTLPVILHPSNPFSQFLLFSSRFCSHLCFFFFPSVSSEAFYCVTHTDSTVPHLHCAFAAAHRKRLLLCLANLPPDALHKMSVVASSFGFIVSGKHQHPASGTHHSAAFQCSFFKMLYIFLKKKITNLFCKEKCTCRKKLYMLSPSHLQQSNNCYHVFNTI